MAANGIGVLCVYRYTGYFGTGRIFAIYLVLCRYRTLLPVLCRKSGVARTKGARAGMK